MPTPSARAFSTPCLPINGSMRVGCSSLICGNPHIGSDYHPNAMVNRMDYDSIDEAVREIIPLEQAVRRPHYGRVSFWMAPPPSLAIRVKNKFKRMLK